MNKKQITDFIKSKSFNKLFCEAEEKQANHFSININNIIIEELPELSEVERLDLIEFFETHLLMTWNDSFEDGLSLLTKSFLIKN